MSTEVDSEKSPHLTTAPIEMGNKEYLDIKLKEFAEKYSEEPLSGLSRDRLQQEEANLIEDFEGLRRRFPHSDYVGNKDKFIQKVQMGDDYRGLSPLTRDQNQQIRNQKSKCYRNLDRALQEAIEREKSENRLSRFGAWLNELAEKLTPIFVLKW